MINRNKFSSFLCFLYVAIYISGQAVGSELLISLSIVTGIVTYLSTFEIKERDIIIWLFLIFFIAFILQINKTYPFSRLVFNLAFISTNILLLSSFLKGRLNVVIILNSVIYFLVLSVLVAFIISMLHHVPVYTYLDSVLVGFSYNYISGLLILTVTLYLAYYSLVNVAPRHGKSISLITFLLCCLLYGRSGIAFSILLVVISFRDYLNVKNGFRSFLIMIFLVLLALFILYNSFVIVDLIQHSKFKEGIQSPRFMMLDQYLDSLDMKTFILGVDITKIPLIASFNFNPHNSYLNLHAMLGIVGVALMSLVIVLIFSLFLRDFIVACYLLIYLGRGALDTIIFPGVLDFVFLGILIGGPYLVKHYNISRCLKC